MDIVLDEREVRILGCLMEKEMTTPEYYPLSLNALTNACNQKSNRNPVVSFDENTVAEGLDSLKQKGLARETHTAGSRVTKYLHELLSRYDLATPEIAVLCELMLRGPQTLGELRSNAGRMSPFESLSDVQETIKGLTEHVPPLAMKLSREPGRKEPRYMHLLSGPGTFEKTTQDSEKDSTAPSDDVVSGLRDEIAQLRNEIEALKQAFIEFKSQF